VTGEEFAQKAAELLCPVTDGPIKNCVAQGFDHAENEPDIAVVAGFVKGVRFKMEAARPEKHEDAQAIYGEMLAACKYLNEHVNGGPS
jgi:hypothetical protein